MQPPISADASVREHTDPEGPFHMGRKWVHPWQPFRHAPGNIADAADERVVVKYNGDYWSMLSSARKTNGRSLYPIPDYPMAFSDLVLHLFIRCAKESFGDAPSSIFPAHATLEKYRDVILAKRSRLDIESRYIFEAGITSSFVLPYLEKLKERREDPVVVLAVHMRVVSYLQEPTTYLGPFVGSGMPSKEEMEEWFGGQAKEVREECDGIVWEMDLVAREVMIRIEQR
ncbi:hypothetical protein AAF712_016507 [Marasmius tenuissimus]|uniref:Uncharacterized protein n=1 Tax=Marasmius tenuissimus TaxID=585030 RepID=A0ABR2Z6I6_9AGAR